jgi:hypothetical protein
MTVVLVVLILVAGLVVVTIAAMVIGLLTDQDGEAPPSQAETKAAVLLHQARRARQLAELEARITTTSEHQIRRWETGDWDPDQ